MVLMMERRYLIDKETLNLIYDMINAPERTMAEKIEKLQMMTKFQRIIEEAEISPWTETIHPWADSGRGLSPIEIYLKEMDNTDAAADAGKEIRS